jgi:hypothetical protein
MNLPAYSNLQYASNAVLCSVMQRIYIFNTEVATMHLTLRVQSSFKLLFYYDPKGINVVCPCSTEYSLFTGLSQTGLQYPLKQYRGG